MRALLRSVGAVCAVVICTWIDYCLLHVNSATAAFTFLLIVLFMAARTGLRESVIASVGSMLAYNFFFLPPVGTFTIADPQNWVALMVFLAVAMIGSQLSASVRRKAEESLSREWELRRMYNFSRALMLGDPDRPLICHAAQQLIEAFGFSAVSVYESSDNTIYQSAENTPPVPEVILRRVAASGDSWRDTENQTAVVPLALGGHPFGSLAAQPYLNLSDVGMTAVAQLVAIALERARAQHAAGLLEAARENEQLKSTLLDALAHEFKTPLTSVKAATTTLLSHPLPDSMTSELVAVIDEETDRMTKLVSDSIELARIGAGRVSLKREWIAPDELLADSLAALRPLFEGHEIELNVEPSLPLVHVDGKLTGVALRQVLGNAVKYSPLRSTVRVGASRLNTDLAVIIRVANEGPGIPLAEQSLLFEKFYRGRDVRDRVAGTGLGLNITRAIIQAQGGRIWLVSQPGAGAEFCFTLPAPALPTVDESSLSLKHSS